MVDIHVQDENFHDNNLIENFESLIWTERYSSSGDFDLKLPATSEHRAILKDAIYFAIPTSRRTMCVETVVETDDGFEVKGRSLESLMDRRVIQTYGPYPSTSLTNFIANLFLYNISTSAPIVERRIPFLSINDAVPEGFTDPAVYDAVKWGEDLYSAIKRLSDGSNLGFNILNNPATASMTFNFIYGRNMTGTINGNPIIFSESIGNIQNVSHLRSDVPLKNVAVVNLPPGDGSVGLGEIWWVGSGMSGIDRREIWTDASDLRKDSTFTESNKPSRANIWGIQELATHPAANEIDFELSLENPYRYDIDYFLGDLVNVVNNSDESLVHRVTEYIQSFGPEGNSAYPTLTAV